MRPKVDGLRDKGVEILTGSEVKGLEGEPGDFQVTIKTPAGEKVERVGAVIVATGFQYLDPSGYTEYGYGRLRNVVTGLEFEGMLKEDRLPFGGDGAAPVVVFVHCVGSRDRSKGFRYCSKVCCNYAAKEATLLKKRYPEARPFVFYIDIRSAGKGYEEFVRDAMEVHGVRYIRGRVAKVTPSGSKLAVRAEDSLVGNPVEIKADMVVLASAVAPPAGAQDLAETLGLETDAYGFFKEEQPNTKPVASSRPGVFLAGACTGPVEIREAVTQGAMAAAEVMALQGGS